MEKYLKSLNYSEEDLIELKKIILELGYEPTEIFLKKRVSLVISKYTSYSYYLDYGEKHEKMIFKPLNFIEKKI